MTIEEYKPMHTKTPLVYSALLSAHSDHNVFLKLETKQVTGSFKPRGIGRSCWDAARRLGQDAHLVVASGGNAGLAAAMASQKLGVKCTIFVHAKTEESIKNRMVDYGAKVTVSDAGWETVNRLALECAAADPKAKYIHPFEGDALIRGHVSIVDEIYDQLPEVMRDAGLTDPTDRPDIISSAVGGGGLIRGIMTGVGERSLQDGRPPVHILGVSAIGGDPWGLSLETDHPVRIESPWSLASSLTCKMCSELAIRDARIYAYNGNLSPDNIETSADVNDTAGPYLSSVRAADAQCGAAAWQVAEELGEGIELSTGAAVVPIYQPKVLDEIIRKKKLPEKLNVVVIVCGGSRLKGIEKFKADYGKGFGDVYVNGEKIM